jgi:predicted SAM-dependent methyltransferase
MSAHELTSYLDELEQRDSRGLERGRTVALVRRVAPPALRELVKVHATTAIAPLSKRRARRYLEHPGPLRLHLGSGYRNLPGWVNIDLVGMRPDLARNLGLGIPFPEGSADSVFLEHVLEHFPYRAVLGILAESRRVLRPGGVLRIGVPDFGRYARSYGADGSFIEQERPGRPTAMLAVGEVALAHGHRSIWDGETLALALTAAGLREARACYSGDSSIEPAPDFAERAGESVYAEGVK